ncbi:MAG: NADH-quinone oxidoreductase subunit C [Vicinamibacterales bacterium]
MTAESLLALLRHALPDAVLDGADAVDQPCLVVGRESLVEACRVLRDTPDVRFSLLAEMTAVDHWPSREPRFEVVYHLACLGVKDFPVQGEHPAAKRVRIKVPVGVEDPVVPTLCGLWPNANWYEREIYDLFGIAFEGHPDLRRILMPEDWEGYPARKDSPLQVKVPVRAESALLVTEQEFMENLKRQRVHRTVHAGPGKAEA